MKVGDTLDGKYKVLKVIGKGGMSTVYLAINERANKMWAIKEVKKSDTIANRIVNQGIVSELKYLRSLRHPYLPSIVDVIEKDHTVMIVMDYVEGITLKEQLRRYGPMGQEKVIDIAKQLCEVLGYLHSRTPAIIYRDVKPANIMLKPSGDIILIDFGTAREQKIEHVEDTTCLGTIGYAAPEQYGGMGQTDQRTDVYGLGATMFHLVTGENPSLPPYEMNGITTYRASLSTGLEYIIKKATMTDPNKRYLTCEQLKYDLNRVVQLETRYIQDRKKKVRQFLFCMFLSFLCFVMSGIVSLYVSGQTQNHYEEILMLAQKTENIKEKLELYEKAILVKEEQLEAYVGMVEVYKTDQVFSKGEEEQLLQLIGRCESLKQNQKLYSLVSFELGKLYWYYYKKSNDSSNTFGMVCSIPWFEEALKIQVEGNPEYMMALVYKEIGVFHKEIQNNVIEGIDRGRYQSYWGKLLQLVEWMSEQKSESEIVPLELYKLAVQSILMYSGKFKADKITKEEMYYITDKIKQNMQGLTATSSRTLQLKEQIHEMIMKIPNTLQIVYE